MVPWSASPLLQACINLHTQLTSMFGCKECFCVLHEWRVWKSYTAVKRGFWFCLCAKFAFVIVWEGEKSRQNVDLSLSLSAPPPPYRNTYVYTARGSKVWKCWHTERRAALQIPRIPRSIHRMGGGALVWTWSSQSLIYYMNSMNPAWVRNFQAGQFFPPHLFTSISLLINLI